MVSKFKSFLDVRNCRYEQNDWLSYLYLLTRADQNRLAAFERHIRRQSQGHCMCQQCEEILRQVEIWWGQFRWGENMILPILLYASLHHIVMHACNARTRVAIPQGGDPQMNVNDFHEILARKSFEEEHYVTSSSSSSLSLSSSWPSLCHRWSLSTFGSSLTHFVTATCATQQKPQPEPFWRRTSWWAWIRTRYRRSHRFKVYPSAVCSFGGQENLIRILGPV